MSPIIVVLAVGLVLLAGSKKPAHRTEECYGMIANFLQDRMRGDPTFAAFMAQVLGTAGQDQTAACVMRYGADPTVDCVPLIIESLRADVAAVGDPRYLRGLATSLRAKGFDEMADCYDQLAASKG